ncbi:hypothetical protein F4802DRAFT_599240 [Xylaria palmicola]|nr:hypothetical protein F4802DRAFT_599240 [Xylaria palmicola]
MDGESTGGTNGNGERVGELVGDKERGRERDQDRDSDTSASATQSRRPALARRDTGSDSHQQRPKHQKRVVAGGAGRFHARVPSSKGLHKNHSQSTAKLRSRASSPEPERPPMFANAHRRTTSDLKLTAVAHDPSDSNANVSHTPSKTPAQPSLASKRNRSHIEIGKRSRSAGNIKRASSHKDVQKLKAQKSQVHFDLGNDESGDGNEDEWVDASASASPYLSRRGSVVSGAPSPAKPPSPTDGGSRPQTPKTANGQSFDHYTPSPTQQRAQHNNYITSRLLQRTPSHGAPPQMSTETASVPLRSGSPTSQASRGPPSLFGTPKTSTLGASGPEELVSRFINGSGPSSGGHGETDSYFIPSHAPLRRSDGGFRRPQSLGNLNHASRGSASEEEEEEEESALAPRSRKPRTPAGESRTQQKLNLQRASSTIDPTPAGPGAGAAGASLFVSGSSDYEHRDPRIGRLLERTGMEYLVVRRYQNPIARSIARLSHIPGASKNRRIPRHHNGTGANARGGGGGASLDLDRGGGGGRIGLSQSMTHLAHAQQSRPGTPRRSASIRGMNVGSGYNHEDDEDDDGGGGRLRDRTSGSSYVDGNNNNINNDDDDDDGGIATLLRNLWEKSPDLGASQE